MWNRKYYMEELVALTGYLINAKDKGSISDGDLKTIYASVMVSCKQELDYVHDPKLPVRKIPTIAIRRQVEYLRHELEVHAPNVLMEYDRTRPKPRQR